MKSKNTQKMLKAMGAALAVCSAAAIMGSTKSSYYNSAKKTMKKTADKVVDFVDTVSALM